jgi:hypothetical protein
VLELSVNCPAMFTNSDGIASERIEFDLLCVSRSHVKCLKCRANAVVLESLMQLAESAAQLANRVANIAVLIGRECE